MCLLRYSNTHEASKIQKKSFKPLEQEKKVRMKIPNQVDDILIQTTRMIITKAGLCDAMMHVLKDSIIQRFLSS